MRMCMLIRDGPFVIFVKNAKTNNDIVGENLFEFGDRLREIEYRRMLLGHIPKVKLESTFYRLQDRSGSLYCLAFL